jgi:hypothetical protein
MAAKKKRSLAVKVMLEERAGQIDRHRLRKRLEELDEKLDVFEALVDAERQRRGLEKPTRLFNGVADFLDLLLEPEAAEDAIDNLAEVYVRRLAANPGHAKRWLIAQVIWIIYGRAMDVFGRFMKARAGK